MEGSSGPEDDGWFAAYCNGILGAFCLCLAVVVVVVGIDALTFDSTESNRGVPWIESSRRKHGNECVRGDVFVQVFPICEQFAMKN